MSDHARPPGTPPAATRALALAALVVAVSAPFWLDRVLALGGVQTPAGAGTAALRSALNAEERRVSALEARMDAAGADLARLRADVGQMAARQEALAGWSGLYALADLTGALRRSEPFALQLGVARAVSRLPADVGPLLEALAPYAAIGVPDAARVARDFGATATRLGWAGQASAPVAVVNRLISWSGRQAAGSGETVRLVSAAGEQVVAGDLAGAIETIGKLDGPARDGFADWLDDAGARVAAERLVRRVDLLVAGGTR